MTANILLPGRQRFGEKERKRERERRVEGPGCTAVVGARFVRTLPERGHHRGDAARTHNNGTGNDYKTHTRHTKWTEITTTDQQSTPCNPRPPPALPLPFLFAIQMSTNDRGPLPSSCRTSSFFFPSMFFSSSFGVFFFHPCPGPRRVSADDNPHLRGLYPRTDRSFCCCCCCWFFSSLRVPVRRLWPIPLQRPTEDFSVHSCRTMSTSLRAPIPIRMQRSLLSAAAAVLRTTRVGRRTERVLERIFVSTHLLSTRRLVISGWCARRWFGVPDRHRIFAGLLSVHHSAWILSQSNGAAACYINFSLKLWYQSQVVYIFPDLK